LDSQLRRRRKVARGNKPGTETIKTTKTDKPDEPDKPDKPDKPDEPDKPDTGIVFDSCTLTGTLASFDVKCTKDITNFTLTVIPGNIKLSKTDDRSLKGICPNCAKFSFAVNHTDGTKSTITVE